MLVQCRVVGVHESLLDHRAIQTIGRGDEAGRHTFARFAIAAGANAKTLSTYMGHANISITLDRYGHLMPGSEKQFVGLMDAYLERAENANEG